MPTAAQVTAEPPSPAPSADASRRPPGWQVVAATATAYALVGAAMLMWAGTTGGYASMLYPSAGLALAATLTYGRAGWLGTWAGATAVNIGLTLWNGRIAPGTLLLTSLVIGAGAALQAAVGAALVRRWVSQPLVLSAPRDIAIAGLAGGALACTASASIATVALLSAGGIAREAAAQNWLTWWTGDTLGVLIATPLVLTLIGRPQADWQPRRRTLGVPLLLALALLSSAMVELSRLDRQRLEVTFERDADGLASEAQARLLVPLHALQALNGAALAHGGSLDRDALRSAARWWLAQPAPLLALGYGERVALPALPAYEAAARQQGPADFRVFHRDAGAAAADSDLLVLRYVEPLVGNAGAVGVNIYSVPAARAALAIATETGAPAATAGFRLTQARYDETGVVLYQALYRGEPGTAAARRAQLRGVVFVTVPTEQAMAHLAQAESQYLHWCLVDPAPGVERPLLAGATDCLLPAATSALRTVKPVVLGGRALELRIAAQEAMVPGHQREATWLLSMAGLAAAAMLGALLLTVTGHTRRTEVAVAAGTAFLRREIADRRTAENALLESEARLRSILDHVPLGVMFLDPQGRIIESNPRLREMLGREAVELTATHLSDLAEGADDAERVLALQRDLLDGGPDQQLDALRLRGAAGLPLTLRLNASALHDAGGPVLRMVAVVEDITETLRLRESERALHRAEAANRAKTEFVSRMSHELRTPLNAMIGFAQLLALDQEPALADHQREWTQQMQRSGWHLLEMINETLDLARIESGAVQLSVSPVLLPGLVAACRSMVANAATERGIALSETIDTDAAAVLADATRLKQVLTNLLSNAVKYNREHGAVELSARRVRAIGDGDGDRVEIAVADTGIGMTPEQMGLLFQPYNRLGREATGIEGTGIGLVISRRLSELMGGRLHAASEAGRGSIFTLSLPAAAPAEVTPSRYTNTSPAPYQERLVHYVEDNETNIEVMRGILAQRSQIRLETSLLGLDGLGSIRRTRPDLVLLDMQLPDISGLELLRHIKQDDRVADIPVIVVSADATAGHRQDALTSGAVQYVTKPIDVRSFLQTVDAILAQADTRWN